MGKNLNRHSTKEDKWMANKHYENMLNLISQEKSEN